MAQGDIVFFYDTPNKMAEGVHNIGTTTHKAALITTLPTVSDASPQLSSYTEVAGNGYVAGGVTPTLSKTLVGSITSFFTSVISWAQTAGGPTNAVAILIYDDDDANDAAFCAIDITSDGGVTPRSLADGDIEFTQNINGIARFDAAQS